MITQADFDSGNWKAYRGWTITCHPHPGSTDGAVIILAKPTKEELEASPGSYPAYAVDRLHREQGATFVPKWDRIDLGPDWVQRFYNSIYHEPMAAPEMELEEILLAQEMVK